MKAMEREQSIIYVTSSHICFSNAEAGISSMDAAGPSPYARFLSTVVKTQYVLFLSYGKKSTWFSCRALRGCECVMLPFKLSLDCFWKGFQHEKWACEQFFEMIFFAQNPINLEF